VFCFCKTPPARIVHLTDAALIADFEEHLGYTDLQVAEKAKHGSLFTDINGSLARSAYAGAEDDVCNGTSIRPMLPIAVRLAEWSYRL
jgi:hypothetical protein